MTTATDRAGPRKFGLGEEYRASQLAEAGTIAVREASWWGRHALVVTSSPCCGTGTRIDAAVWAGDGAPVTCAGCGWRYDVYLAIGELRLAPLPRSFTHPDIAVDRAEWVSLGRGQAPRVPGRRPRRKARQAGDG